MGSSKIEASRGWLSYAMLVFGFIGSVYTAVGFIHNNWITRSDLENHNVSDNSHSDLRDSTKLCVHEIQELRKYYEKTINEAREESIVIAAALVRQTAVDSEPDKRLKAAAGYYYETQFKRQIRKENASIRDTMIDVLNQPWYNKPR